VRLNGTSPTGGTSVALTTSVPAVLTVPASVTVPAGSNSQNFTASAGAISSGQNATIRAQVAQTAITFPIALSPAPSSLSTLTCSPVSLAPGTGGTCTVTLTSAAESSSMVILRSTNTALTLPSSVTIPTGSLSASFSFALAPTMTGWAIVSANLSTVTKSVTITAATARSNVGKGTHSSLRLRCDQKQIAPGGKLLCEVLYAPTDEEAALEMAVSTTSERLKAPAFVRGRAARTSLRFEVAADEDASLETVAVEVRSGSASARESVLIMPDRSLHLRLPHSLSVTPGSPVRFTAAAIDDQGLPVSVTAASKPGKSVFDAATGLFEWTPADHDLGSATVEFTAANSLGLTATGTVNIDVIPSRPVLSRLRNGAGSGAVAACSPGAVATLLGSSLAERSTGTPHVLVNGAEVSVLQASDKQVDFLCPTLAPGTSLEISVSVGGRASNGVKTVMQGTAPGLLSMDGSGSGQGVVAHARGLAALPRFGQEGTPAIAGEEITLLATGINCGEIFAAPKPLLYLGHDFQPITLLRPSAFPGVCEVHSVIPAGVSGNEVALVLEIVREDGSSVRSNAILMAIE